MSHEHHGPAPPLEPQTADLLLEVHAWEVERPRMQHRDRTPDCLSLPALDRALTSGFTTGERVHVTACSFCQKVIAMVWRLECPSLTLVLLHLAPSSPVSGAMAEHLERDGCRRCQRLTGSRVVKVIVDRLGQCAASLEGVDVPGAAADFGFLPAAVGAFASPPWVPAVEDAEGIPVGEADEQGSPWPFRLRAKVETGMTAILRQTDRDTLVVHVQSANPVDAGRSVHVEVAGEYQSLEASVLLERRGRRCEGRYTFGRLADLRPQLGGSCALVVAFADQARGRGDCA